MVLQSPVCILSIIMMILGSIPHDSTQEPLALLSQVRGRSLASWKERTERRGAPAPMNSSGYTEWHEEQSSGLRTPGTSLKM